MIENSSASSFRLWRFLIAALAALCLSSFGLSAWLLADFRREQAILEKITENLPAVDLPNARALASELRLQLRLVLLLVVNLFGSALALAMLARAYHMSERHLRRVHIQAEDILASLDQGVLTADQDGRLLNVTPKGQELIGQPPLGTRFALSELPESHRPLDEMRKAVVSGRSVEERQYSVELGHHIRYLRAGCSVLRDHDKHPAGVVIHLRDVTEKTLMQQRLLRMERYMGLGSLAAGLQHEIKNPLSALALHVQLLKEGFAKNRDEEAIRESLDVLYTEVRRIARVLESFRDFASIKALDFAVTDLRKLIEGIAKLTSVQAGEMGVEIEVVCQEGAEFVVKADATRMEQVILNLIVNAFAAMPQGGALTITLSRTEEQIQVEVMDTGCGIPVELQDKVFDPYFTTKATGDGMGLALCDKIVRQHEGTIDFVTSPSGTTFSIRLPTDIP